MELSWQKSIHGS
uniref:Early nodulin n=1 Tax=Lupinus luteus TaxID=3873 RepID=Q93WF2_LUPLU|nr:early nodulin [Lupinus luteus]AAK51422.1 early nodulin [Lupinus luteus]